MTERRLPPACLGFRASPWLWLVLGILCIDGIHQLLYAQSSFTPLHDWLRGRATDDSWRHMQQAYEAVRSPHQEPLYQLLFFQDGVKFQYPLTSLLPPYLADQWGIRLGSGRLNAVSRVVLLLEALVVAQIAYEAFKARATPRTPRRTLYAAWVAGALMSLSFYPVLKAYSLGQVQTWLNAWFALACLAWMRGQLSIAGALIGLVCLFKPQFALFLPWALLRRQWHFAAGWGLVVLAGAAWSIGLFGLRDNLDYLSVVSHMSRHGEAYYPNQSVNGLFHRLLGNGDSFHWPEHELAPYHPVVHAATLISSVALLLPALWFRRRAPRFSVVDLLIAALSFTMASPIAWEHHYGVMSPAFPVLAALLWDDETPASRPASWGLLVLAFLFCSRFWPSAQELALSWANVAQSYLFLASLVVLWLLYRMRDRAAGRLGTEAVTAERAADPTGQGSPALR
ncbi:glycosyltransferase family 87 protein [Azohydromonas caseinilytica]|uniref:DUF2029 domain-containing protein n=1 Tax=Azohydromonas caseinilytica TaxID=2728836 RepID=A0A848FC81_9BURK|nr:glycosyltransferase family 87 protein [Azohydromonas caseinilytica]NML17084.1 DUF2029 domain-containing protein [Azohydromonas caseinilytica]